MQSAEAIRKSMAPNMGMGIPVRPTTPFNDSVDAAATASSPKYAVSYLNPENYPRALTPGNIGGSQRATTPGAAPLSARSNNANLESPHQIRIPGYRREGLEEDSRSTISFSSQIPLMMVTGDGGSKDQVLYTIPSGMEARDLAQGEPFLQRIHSSCLSQYTGDGSMVFSPSLFTVPPPASIEPSYSEEEGLNADDTSSKLE